MSMVKGTLKNGQVILDEPADWPEGCRVVVEPVEMAEGKGAAVGEWPTDPEGIARHLALMDTIEPLEMTPEEEEAWIAARKAQKEFELSRFEEHSRRIEELFE